MYYIPFDSIYDCVVSKNIITAVISLLFKIYKYFGVTHIILCSRKSSFCKAMCFLQDIPYTCQTERPMKREFGIRISSFLFLFLFIFVLLQNESTMTPHAATIAEDAKSNTFFFFF